MLINPRLMGPAQLPPGTIILPPGPFLGAQLPLLRPWRPPVHVPRPFVPPGVAYFGRAGPGVPLLGPHRGGPKPHARSAPDGGGRAAKRHKSGEQGCAAADPMAVDLPGEEGNVDGQTPSNRGAAEELRVSLKDGNRTGSQQDGLAGMDTGSADGDADAAAKKPLTGQAGSLQTMGATAKGSAGVLDLAAAKQTEEMQQLSIAATAEGTEGSVSAEQCMYNGPEGQGRPSGSGAALDAVMEEAREGSQGHRDSSMTAEETGPSDERPAEAEGRIAAPNRAQEAAKEAAMNAPKMIVACPSRSPSMPEYLKAMASRRDSSQVLFLGTGCAEASKYRGGAAVHVRLADGRGLLLDAGEGALGQLVRHFGPAGAAKQVDALFAVWVSHKHADHMLGLPGILRARSAGSPPLLFIGPSAAQKWLAEAGPALQLRYHFVHCREFDADEGPTRAWLLNMTGMVSWQSVPVEHCADAFGLVMRHVSGWSLVYSGDTRPCRRLQAAGRGCTLLIHEATFEPALESQARQKRHSTTEEALRLAARMGAYRVILTHFSSRYPKVPVGLPSNGPLSEMVASAYDGMRVPLMLLPEVPRLMPAIAAALSDEPGAEGKTGPMLTMKLP